MAILLAAGYAAVYEFAVVLEIQKEDVLSAFPSADFADAVIHILSLFRCQHQLRTGIVADRHEMEVPGEQHSFINKEIQELITGNSFVVLACIADGGAVRQFVLVHQIHGIHDLLENTFAAAGISGFRHAFHAHGKDDILDLAQIIAERLVDQRSVCEDNKAAVLMLSGQLNDIFFTDKRFAAGHDIAADTQRFSLADQAVHIFI